ncbi:MAG: hypothetical protein D3926_08105 [Desulfobacteraceae bacterium]|nr:MAG: hypothetical protein D3926_08105 [Desulfobacteraceae bacterium]
MKIIPGTHGSSSFAFRINRGLETILFQVMRHHDTRQVSLIQKLPGLSIEFPINQVGMFYAQLEYPGVMPGIKQKSVSHGYTCYVSMTAWFPETNEKEDHVGSGSFNTGEAQIPPNQKTSGQYSEN